VCGLAHFLETERLASVLIGLIPQHVAAMRPPRALLVPFSLGRPLGGPHDGETQASVLRAALGLLDHVDELPLVDRFDTDDVAIDPKALEGWNCPVSFALPSPGAPLIDRVAAEVPALIPWFEREVASRHRTATASSGLEIDAVCGWLGEFLNEPAPSTSPRPEHPLGLTFKLAIEDLRAFYLEAATAGPGSPSSRHLSHWFWRETAAGGMLLQLRTRLRDHADPGVRVHARFMLVPESELTSPHGEN